MAGCTCGQHPHASWCIIAGPEVTVGRVTFGPGRGPLESHAVIGDRVYDMHTKELIGVLGRQRTEFDLQLRELRRSWLVDARQLRLDADVTLANVATMQTRPARELLREVAGGQRGYGNGLRDAARKLREVLR